MADSVRVIVADDERPARSFLVALLRAMPGVTVVGQAADGSEAVSLIERQRPDVAFLDLQMPDVDGLQVVKLLKRRFLPLVVFVTAYDEYAVKAFELNAVDYLTKPASEARVREALRRVHDRLDRADLRERAAAHVRKAMTTYETIAPRTRLDRIPVRRKEEILLLPVTQVASIVAEGELLHLTTTRNERHTIAHRLKDLEARLDPARFVRLSRGTLANVDHISHVTPMPGAMYCVRMSNGQELDVSRIQSRHLRTRLLRL
jgi:two-component system, LytTR family, response regulator